MGVSVDVAEPRVMRRWRIGSPVGIAIIPVVSQAEERFVVLKEVIIEGPLPWWAKAFGVVPLASSVGFLELQVTESKFVFDCVKPFGDQIHGIKNAVNFPLELCVVVHSGSCAFGHGNVDG